jgi:hypothetical protein
VGGQSNTGGSTSTGTISGGSTSMDSTGGSSSSHTGSSTSAGGNTSSLPSDAGIDPNATAGCPTWPSSKLFPFVGAFFYGTNPKPCTISQHSDTVLTFQYDSAGQVMGAANADNTQRILYTFTDGRMTKEVDTTSTAVTTYVVEYGTGTVKYTASGETLNYTGTYLLDARGYPLSATMVATSPRAYTSRYTYAYENCRMIARYEFDDSGSTTPYSTVLYDYDSQGHMVRMYSTNGSFEWVWGYSC